MQVVVLIGTTGLDVDLVIYLVPMCSARLACVRVTDANAVGYISWHTAVPVGLLAPCHQVPAISRQFPAGGSEQWISTRTKVCRSAPTVNRNAA